MASNCCFYFICKEDITKHDICFVSSVIYFSVGWGFKRRDCGSWLVVLGDIWEMQMMGFEMVGFQTVCLKSGMGGDFQLILMVLFVGCCLFCIWVRITF